MKRIKLSKLKYENIAFILCVCFSIQAMIHHINLNGIYSELALELVMYAFMCYGVRYVVWFFRKYPKQVLRYFIDL